MIPSCTIYLLCNPAQTTDQLLILNFLNSKMGIVITETIVSRLFVNIQVVNFDG